MPDGILRENRSDESAATAGHPARDGDGEKIRAGIPAAAQCVKIRSRALFFLQQFLRQASKFVRLVSVHKRNANYLRLSDN